MMMSLAEIDVWTKKLDNVRCLPFTLDLDNTNLFNSPLSGEKKKKTIVIQFKIGTHNNNN